MQKFTENSDFCWSFQFQQISKDKTKKVFKMFYPKKVEQSTDILRKLNIICIYYIDVYDSLFYDFILLRPNPFDFRVNREIGNGDGGLSTLCHSWRFACQKRVLWLPTVKKKRGDWRRQTAEMKCDTEQTIKLE